MLEASVLSPKCALRYRKLQRQLSKFTPCDIITQRAKELKERGPQCQTLEVLSAFVAVDLGLLDSICLRGSATCVSKGLSNPCWSPYISYAGAAHRSFQSLERNDPEHNGRIQPTPLANPTRLT